MIIYFLIRDRCIVILLLLRKNKIQTHILMGKYFYPYDLNKRSFFYVYLVWTIIIITEPGEVNKLPHDCMRLPRDISTFNVVAYAKLDIKFQSKKKLYQVTPFEIRYWLYYILVVSIDCTIIGPDFSFKESFLLLVSSR